MLWFKGAFKIYRHGSHCAACRKEMQSDDWMMEVVDSDTNVAAYYCTNDGHALLGEPFDPNNAFPGGRIDELKLKYPKPHEVIPMPEPEPLQVVSMTRYTQEEKRITPASDIPNIIKEVVVKGNGTSTIHVTPHRHGHTIQCEVIIEWDAE